MSVCAREGWSVCAREGGVFAPGRVECLRQGGCSVCVREGE